MVTIPYSSRAVLEREVIEEGHGAILPLIKNVKGTGFVYLSDALKVNRKLFNRIVEEAFVSEEKRETSDYSYSIIEGKVKDFGIIYGLKDTSCLGRVREIIITVEYLQTLPIFKEGEIELACL